MRKGENPNWLYYFLFVGVFYVKRPLLIFTGYLVLVLLIIISIIVSRKFDSVGRVVSLFLMRNASPSVYTNWYEKELLYGRSYIAENSALGPYHSTRVVRTGEVAAGKVIAGLAGKVAAPGVVEGGAKVVDAINSANAVGKAGVVVGVIVTGVLLAEHALVNHETNQHRPDGGKKSTLQSMLEATYGNAASTLPETPDIPDDSDKKGGSGRWGFGKKG
jgi:hypothetical protein